MTAAVRTAALRTVLGMLDVTAARRGEVVSTAPEFEEVYRRHSGPLFRYCLSQLRDAQLAEDVAADAFSSAWQSWGRRRPDADGVRPWLFRIARNAAVDAHRRRERGRRAVARLASSGVDEGIEGGVMLRGELRRVVAAVATLGDRDRQLIGLRVAAGLCFAEVAQVMGMREQAAKVATHRALERVRRLLDDTETQP